MHFQSTLIALALALTATAIPNPSPQADRIAPEVPASSPAPTNPSPTVTPTPNPSPSPDNRDWPKFQSNPENPDQGLHHNNKDNCPDLCSLMAEACTIAVPNDEAFW